MQARMPGERREHVLPFSEKRAFPGMEVTLLPAGHIFGSAQILVEASGQTLLYTGDFKLRQGRSAKAAQWQNADTLIMENDLRAAAISTAADAWK